MPQNAKYYPEKFELLMYDQLEVKSQTPMLLSSEIPILHKLSPGCLSQHPNWLLVNIVISNCHLWPSLPFKNLDRNLCSAGDSIIYLSFVDISGISGGPPPGEVTEYMGPSNAARPAVRMQFKSAADKHISSENHGFDNLVSRTVQLLATYTFHMIFSVNSVLLFLC